MKKQSTWMVILLIGVCSLAQAVNLPLKIDFNKGSSATMSGYTGFAVATYSASRGYGWDKMVSAIIVKGSNDLYNDKHYSNVDATFKVDLPNGTYTVSIYGYNASYYDKATYDKMQITAEGTLVAESIHMSNYDRQFDVTVADGQLDLLFHDNGGSGDRWCISGMQITKGIVRPVIQSHQGAVGDGAQITLQGTSFGNGPNITLFDDFSGGTANEAIPNTSPDIGEWSSAGSYSNLGRSGTTGYKMRSSRLNVQFANCQEFYFSYCVIIPPGTLFPNATSPGSYVPSGEKKSVWKLAWIMDGADGHGGNDDICLPTHVSPKFTIAGNGVQPGFGTGNWWWSFKNWVRISVWIKADPAAPTAARGKIFFQGIAENERHYQQVASNKVVMNSDGDGAKWNYLNIPGWSYGCGTNCGPFYDDIYLATGANARARIEIGNKPRYRDCTKLAVCTPSSWTSTSITADLRLGSLDPGGDLYAYVVAANGVVGPAYLLSGNGDGGQTAVQGTRVIFRNQQSSTGYRIVDIQGRTMGTQGSGSGIRFVVTQQGNRHVVKPVLVVR